MSALKVIDGAAGEGGGQVLRTSLALAAVRGVPVRIENVRGGRKKPGLLRQHLTGLQALAEICQAEVQGDALKSRQVEFRPRAPRAGSYHFSIGTAGSTGLVLQTILWPLMLADGPSTVIIDGGTHNKSAPPFPFLRQCFVPILRSLGAQIDVVLERPGFYPAGGGRIRVEVRPSSISEPLDLRGPAPERTLHAVAYCAALPKRIAQRELSRLGERLELAGGDRIALTDRDDVAPSRGPGNACWILACEDAVTNVMTAFGEKGVSAETVADGLADQVGPFLRSGARVDEHLADQLLIPLALGAGGAFSTVESSLHTTTNITVIGEFLDASIEVSALSEGRCTISVSP